MNSDAIIGLLTGGGLLFISSLLVPFLTKKLNKGIDAAQSAEKYAGAAGGFAEAAAQAAARLVGTEKELEEVKTSCSRCLHELAELKRRDELRDHALDAVHVALLEIVPLLDADAEGTRILRAAIRTVRNARYADQ